MATSPGISRLALRESGLKRSVGRASRGKSLTPILARISSSDWLSADAVGGAQGLRRDARVRAVDQHQEVRRLAALPLLVEVGGDLDPHRGAAGHDLLAEGGARRRVAHHLEVAGVHEVVDQRPALGAPALVEDHRRHVPDVGVDQSEEDELEDRDGEREAERRPVADHLQPLLAKDGAEASHRSPFVRQGLEAGEAHEDVLERRGDRPHVHRRAGGFCQLALDLGVVAARVHQQVEGVAEDGDVLHPGLGARLSHQRRGPLLAGRLDPPRPLGGDLGEVGELVRLPLDQHAREVDVPHLAAALGLVHVVGGDEEGDVLRREVEEEVPQLAAGDRIDAGRGLVEKEDARPVHHGGGERQALLPTARELAGQPGAVRADAGQLDRPLAALLEDRPLEAVDVGEEVEVLEHREVLVERELLRHVADAAADLLAVAGDVEPVDRRLPLGGRQQAAEDADQRRLPRAVRPQEAIDLAARHAERDLVEGAELAEVAGDPLGEDAVVDVRVRIRVRAGDRRGEDGWSGGGLAHRGAPGAAAEPGSARVTIAAMPGFSSGVGSIATLTPKT